MNNTNKYKIRIGIFDSGSGGLTVLKELTSGLPYAEFIYLGDIARMPYGEKTPEAIVKIGLQNTRYLIEEHDVDMVVVACNTASSYMGTTMADKFNIPIVGMIEAVSIDAIDRLKLKRESTLNSTQYNLCVIATKATIGSESYQKTLAQVAKDNNLEITTHAKATPLLAPLVEEGIIKGEIAKLLIEHYLTDIPMDKIDVLVIGCTHYPLFSDIFKELYPNLILADGSRTVTTFVQNAIKNIRLHNKNTPTANFINENSNTASSNMLKGNITILTTAPSAELAKLAHSLLGNDITIKSIPLSDVNKPICEYNLK